MLASGVAALAAACSGPPAATAADAAAPVADAAAEVADAAPVDAGPDAGELDPHDIRLTPVTSLFGRFLGGQGLPNPFGVGSGAAVGDVDGDGDLDLFLARCDGGDPDHPGGPSLLLRQEGAGGFDRFASDPAVATSFAGSCAHAAAFGDYDGDGDLDLFVAMDGFDRLLANDGSGHFSDVTASAGVGGAGDARSTGAVWADVNADGLLDLYVPQQSDQIDAADDPRNADRLHLGRGGGLFEDVSVAAGIADDGVSHAAAIANLDGDPALEIYVANDRFAIEGVGADPRLDGDRFYDLVSLDDQGRPLFSQRSSAYELDGPKSAMGVALADLDGDGRDEIYLSDFGSNHLYQWREDAGRYDDVAADWGVAWPRSLSDAPLVSWAAAFVDLDRDGSEELAVVNGSVAPAVNCDDYSQLDLLLRRDPGADRFADVTAFSGWPWFSQCEERPRGMQFSGRGLVVADLDGDGDDDLLITPYLEHYELYETDTVAAHGALRVWPVGTVSAPLPVGAVLELRRSDGAVVRRRLAAGGATGSQSAPVLVAGLGTAEVVEARLHWPSGYVQRLDSRDDFALDRDWRVVEPAWLSLSARAAGAADPTPVLTYRPVDAEGALVGPGLAVTALRSDGVAATAVDQGDGRYTVALPHPGTARVTTVTLSVDGVALAPRPSLRFR